MKVNVWPPLTSHNVEHVLRGLRKVAKLRRAAEGVTAVEARAAVSGDDHTRDFARPSRVATRLLQVVTTAQKTSQKPSRVATKLLQVVTTAQKPSRVAAGTAPPANGSILLPRPATKAT